MLFIFNIDNYQNFLEAVSPSAACYGESASTLRWASQARQLPARPNVTKTAVTKSEIQAQYNQLIAQLENHFIQYVRLQIAKLETS